MPSAKAVATVETLDLKQKRCTEYERPTIAKRKISKKHEQKFEKK